MSVLDRPTDPVGRLDVRFVRRVTVTVVVALGVLVGLPWAVAAAVAHDVPRVVAPRTAMALPGTPTRSGHYTAPVGWALAATASPIQPDDVFVRPGGQLRVSAAVGVRDVDVYAARVVRAAAVLRAVQATPDGRVAGPAELSGPRFRIRDAAGRTGELLVLARGGTAVAVDTLTDPSRPADPAVLVPSLVLASPMPARSAR